MSETATRPSTFRHGVLVLVLATTTSCTEVQVDEGQPLLGDPHAVELLVERAEVEAPPSDAPNRFYGGWVPHDVGRARALRAAPEGASFQVVTLTPGRRELALDLVDDGRLSRLAHVQVRVDRG